MPTGRPRGISRVDMEVMTPASLASSSVVHASVCSRFRGRCRGHAGTPDPVVRVEPFLAPQGFLHALSTEIKMALSLFMRLTCFGADGVRLCCEAQPRLGGPISRPRVKARMPKATI